jgi:lipopolysaccharide export system permease protein
LGFPFHHHSGLVGESFCVRTLHFYLLRQIIATLLMTAMIFTFVLLLVNGLREILPLLGQVSPWVVLKVLALLIPFLWAFALPMGMLTATLMVFGRFSADQELTAARAGGVSLLALVSPILALSLVLCAVSMAVNLEIAPRCKVAYNRLRDQSKLAFLSSFQLPAGQYIKYVSNYIIWAAKNTKGDLEDVRILKYENETNLSMSLRAPRGRYEVDMTNRLATLRLFDARMVLVISGLTTSEKEITIPYDFSKTGAVVNRKPALSDMTFGQLRNELREEETAANVSFSSNQMSQAEIKLKRALLQKQFQEMGEPARVQLHRQMAFSFACFGFTLVGIPLGIRVHRRETNIGIVIALGLVALYFALILVGDAFNTRPELAPHLLMWAPNFLFQTFGAALLWRANRGV